MARFAEGGKKIDGLSKRLDDAKGHLKKLQTEFANTPRASAAMIAGLDRAKAKVGGLETQLEKENATLARTGEALRRVGVDTGNLAGEQARLEKHAKRVADVMKRQEAAQTRFTKSREGVKKWAVAGAAMAGAGYTMMKPVKAAADYEETEIDFSKFVEGGDTAEGLRAISDEILKIGKSSLLGADGVGKLLIGYSKLGMGKDEAMGAAKATEVLAVGLEMTADEASDTVVALKQSMKLGVKDMLELGDAINYIGDVTAAGGRTTTEILKRQGGFVKSTTKLSNEHIVALAASFDSTKMGAEVSATAMKNFIGALTRGKGAQKAEIKAWELIGMNPVKIAAEMQKDGRATIMKVMKAVANVNDRDRAYVLTKIFKKESIGPIASLLSNLDGMEEIMGKLDDRTKFLGRSQSEYNRQISGFNAKWTILKNKLQIGMILIGKNYLPYMSKFLDKIAEGFEKAFGWIERNPRAFAKMSMAVAGVFLLTSAVVGLGLALSTVKFALSGLNLGLANLAVRRIAARSALRETAGVLATDAAMMAAPVPVRGRGAARAGRAAGRSGMAGAAVGAASLVSVKVWGRVFTPVGRMVGRVGKGLRALLNPVGLARVGFMKLGVVLRAVVVPVLKVIGSSVSAIFSPVGALVAVVVAAGVAIWKYWEPIKAFVVGFGSGFIEAIQPVIELVKGLWASFDRATGFTSRFAESLAWVSDTASKVWGWIKELFTPVSESAEVTRDAAAAGREWGKIVGDWVSGKLAGLVQVVKDVIAHMPILKAQATAAFIALKVTAIRAFEAVKAVCVPVIERFTELFMHRFKPVIDLASDGIDRLRVVVGKVAAEIKGRGLPVVKFLGAAVSACATPINMLVTAVGFVAVSIRKYWEPIKSFVKGFAESFMQAIQPARELLVRLAHAAGAVWEAVTSLAKTFYEVSGLSTLVESALKVINTAFDWVVRTVTGLVRWVGDALAKFDEWIGLSKALGEAWGWVCEKAEAFWGWVTRLFEPISKTADETKKAGDVGKEWGKIIGNTLVGGLEKFTGFLEKIPGWLKKLEDGMVSAFKKIKEFCQPILDKLNGGMQWLDRNFGSLDQTLHTISFGAFGEGKAEAAASQDNRSAALRPSVKPVGYYANQRINQHHNNTFTINVSGAGNPQETALAVRDAMKDLPGKDDSSMMDDPVLVFA